METINANTWNEFLDVVDDEKAGLRSRNSSYQGYPSSLLFRGQANSSWALETTLDRYVGRRIPIHQYQNFLAACVPTVQSLTGQKWDFCFEPTYPIQDVPPNYEFMIYARHHGLPSPLLDWSASPYVALFFAFSQIPTSRYASVYLLDERGNRYAARNLNLPHFIRLGPAVTTHRRHFLQQAEYTICVVNGQPGGTLADHLHQDYVSHDIHLQSDEGDQEYIKNVVLPTSLREEVLGRLHEMNINAYSLFGNEEGLLNSMAFSFRNLLPARSMGS